MYGGEPDGCRLATYAIDITVNLITKKKEFAGASLIVEPEKKLAVYLIRKVRGSNRKPEAGSRVGPCPRKGGDVRHGRWVCPAWYHGEDGLCLHENVAEVVLAFLSPSKGREMMES